MRRWFFHIARAEGLSLLVLFGIAMPVKYLAGEPVLVEWVGWIHGLLFLVYVIALGAISVLEEWPMSRSILGFVASFVPFGTFAFERRVVAAAEA